MSKPSLTGIWLTDRSRHASGLGHCQRARYYQYHAGPDGYGIVRKSQSMPLATGIYVHACLAGILIHCQEAEALQGHTPAEEDFSKPEFRKLVRGIIQKQLSEYRALVKERGWLNIEGRDEVLYAIEEQCSLVEGLVWAWTKIMLPMLLREFKVECVEEEELYVIDESHQEPDTTIAMMCRPDIVLRSRKDNSLSLHDFKTASSISDAWIEEWRHSVQTASYTHAVESRIGEPVNTYYIHAIIKGQRRAEYNTVTREYDGPKRQNSIFCYAYHRPASPPFVAEDYQPRFKYKDSLGKGHTLGRDYSKTPVWQMPGGAEAWVARLESQNPQALLDQFAFVGPYDRQDFLIKSYIKEMAHEERRWTQKLWNVYEASKTHGETSLQMDEALAENIPRSWACTHYGAPCQFVPLCFKHIGWEDPLASGQYVARRPHHDLEIAQMRQRGIEPPPPEVGEDE